jgi:hypothetical protein
MRFGKWLVVICYIESKELAIRRSKEWGAKSRITRAQRTEIRGQKVISEKWWLARPQDYRLRTAGRPA